VQGQEASASALNLADSCDVEPRSHVAVDHGLQHAVHIAAMSPISPSTRIAGLIDLSASLRVWFADVFLKR
jgi:hypothetical protein